jgi:signal transduction histidine kinase
MKKYILALLLLISIGAVLGYFTVKQNRLLDDEVYLETTASVRNLKLIDNTINILLFTIRHENKTVYADLEIRSIDLSDEFDNLRYDALFEEIESSPELSDATIGFEQALLAKQDAIEKFIRSHQTLIEANQAFYASAKIDSPINQITEKLSLKADIISININFYRYLEDNRQENKDRLNNDIAHIEGMIQNYTDEEKNIIYDYIKTLSNIILASEETQRYFALALEQKTGEALNILEAAYVNFHNIAIEKSTKLRNALIGYGLLLLILVIIFSYLLRKQYLGLEQEVADRTEEIQQAYIELQESQEQLIQSEKMASLGEMVAGVAHEINTPLGYINSNLSTIQLNLNDISHFIQDVDNLNKEARSPTRDKKKLSTLLTTTLKKYSTLKEDGIFDESQQLLEDSTYGLGEISKLVMSLKDFSRLDRQSTDQVDVHDCIENALNIAVNHIKENHVTIIREFAKLPKIVCIPSKLNQLFLNIITNASQAMKEQGGELKITTRFAEESIVVAFTDKGIGMDEATSQKMFDPFFTSKPIGEGTGLGMSIAYKIVDAHGGKIKVKSKPNVGTTVAIQLPIEAPSSLN